MSVVAPTGPAVAKIIDGKAIAAELRAGIGAAVRVLRDEHGFTPGLAVVLVGDDPASQVYVRNKGRQAREADMNSFIHALPSDTSQDKLLSLVRDLNEDASVNGILVQLPLPLHIDAQAVLNLIDPARMSTASTP